MPAGVVLAPFLCNVVVSLGFAAGAERSPHIFPNDLSHFEAISLPFWERMVLLEKDRRLITC
jgi:hypothetical protein